MEKASRRSWTECECALKEFWEILDRAKSNSPSGRRFEATLDVHHDVRKLGIGMNFGSICGCQKAQSQHAGEVRGMELDCEIGFLCGACCGFQRLRG